jgi:molybdate transport repressor ModE-like protein
MSDLATSPVDQARLRWSWAISSALSEADTAHLFALLGALVDNGALGVAAKTAGMSYRSAWGLLRRSENALGVALVVMERGRGTRLSELGAEIMQLDSLARVALAEVHAPWAQRLQTLLLPTAASQSARLRIAASHDLALADWIEREGHRNFDLCWRGSEDALAGLGRDEYDIAGFHVPEAWSSTQLTTWLAQWLKPQQHVCMAIMQRCQGLIVAPGNPLNIQSLSDVSKPGVRMVNRQRGSGTRSLIDQLLKANGLRPETIEGYSHEEFTHEAVAATIACGKADVGFGIQAAATRYQLDFISLVNERYGVAMQKSFAAGEQGRRFLAQLSGERFRQGLATLAGYQPLVFTQQGAWADFLG